MRNGSGDEFIALFNAGGCFLKGFAHEYPMSPFAQCPKRNWPGLLDGVPAEFAACLKEPAFSMEAITFCLWRRYADNAWKHGPVEFPAGPDPDGSEFLLSVLDGKPATYKVWAERYYGQPVSLAAVRQVYAHEPLTEELVRQLNPELSVGKLAADIEQIGYPS